MVELVEGGSTLGNGASMCTCSHRSASGGLLMVVAAVQAERSV